MRMAIPILLVTALGALAACGRTSTDAAALAAGAAPGVTHAPTSVQVPAAEAADSAVLPGAYRCDVNARLNADDVALYLSVMREAAAIVQHPTAADAAERQRAKVEAAANAQAWASAQQQESALTAADQKIRAALQAAQRSGDFTAVAAATKAAMAVNAAAAGPSARMPPAQTPAEEAESNRVSQLDSGLADVVVVDQRHLDERRWDCLSRKVEDAIPPPGTVFGEGDPVVNESAADRAAEAAFEAEVAANKVTLAPHALEIRALEQVVRALPAARSQP